MLENLTIRRAIPTDLPAILAIYESARQFMAENGNPDQWGNGYPDEAVVREDLEQEQLYVCTDGGTIAGAFCYFEGVEPDYLEIFDGCWPNKEPYGVVHRLAVGGKRRGIASFCLEYAFSRCGNLRIDTHRNNIPMQRTLTKNGFQLCGIVHCQHGGDRIAYQKT